jgi:hypothetical protein
MYSNFGQSSLPQPQPQPQYYGGTQQQQQPQPQYYGGPQQPQPQYYGGPQQQQQQQPQYYGGQPQYYNQGGTGYQPIQFVSNGGPLLDQLFGPSDKALVQERIQPFELITGIEAQNKYDVHMSNGYHIIAVEESSFMSRFCLGSAHPFTLHIFTKDTKEEFLTMERPFKFLFQEIRVYETRNRNYLGKVVLDMTCCTRTMSVYNESDMMIYKVNSPVCSFWEFFIETPNQERIGSIKKKWTNFFQEFYTNANNFGIHFPPAPPRHKALLFAAIFLIDFLYYEREPNNDNNF